jgi:LysM repeat protein
MTSKQAIFIILVNALISTLISVTVALIVILPAQMGSSATQLLPATTAQATAVTQEPPGPADGPASAQPTATPILYVVQAGDTLSSLAMQFDVPAVDIVAANQIQNPDFLPAGVELVIPIGGLPPATITWTPIPTASGTPIPFEPPSVELSATAADGMFTPVMIPSTTAPASEELRVAIAEVAQAGDVEQERVIIANTGGQVADLEGWTLSDADGNAYLFPNYRLWAGGSVTIHTGVGQDGNPLTSLFWGKLQPIWSPGETATLRDAEGRVIATYAIGP